MGIIEGIRDFGVIVGLLTLMGVILTYLLPMAAHIGDPSYPMIEVGTAAIAATVMILVPSGLLGWIFFAAGQASR